MHVCDAVACGWANAGSTSIWPPAHHSPLPRSSFLAGWRLLLGSTTCYWTWNLQVNRDWCRALNRERHRSLWPSVPWKEGPEAKRFLSLRLWLPRPTGQRPAEPTWWSRSGCRTSLGSRLSPLFLLGGGFLSLHPRKHYFFERPHANIPSPSDRAKILGSVRPPPPPATTARLQNLAGLVLLRGCGWSTGKLSVVFPGTPGGVSFVEVPHFSPTASRAVGGQPLFLFGGKGSNPGVEVRRLPVGCVWQDGKLVAAPRTAGTLVEVGVDLGRFNPFMRGGG